MSTIRVWLAPDNLSVAVLWPGRANPVEYIEYSRPAEMREGISPSWTEVTSLSEWSARLERVLRPVPTVETDQ